MGKAKKREDVLILGESSESGHCEDMVYLLTPNPNLLIIWWNNWGYNMV